MSTPPSPSKQAQLRERAERNLGALVIAIEFTLISVMVGVILFPLMDFATPILRELKFEYMLYVVSGLILILYTWSEVVSHSLTFIGWPMDMFHNLLYIVTAMLLAIQMHFLQDPLGWFALTTLSVIVAAVVSYYDKRVLQDRLANAKGAEAELYQTALKRQDFLVRVFPSSIFVSILQVALIYLFPSIFIDGKAHLVLIASQIAVFSFLIYRTLSAFQSAREQILQKAIQALWSEES